MAGACATASAESETRAEPPAIALIVDDSDEDGPDAPVATTTPPSTAMTKSASPTTTPPLPNSNETLIAIARASLDALEAYDQPDGEPLDLPFTVPNPHQFGGPLTLMITEGDRGDDWVKVQLPIRPNGSEGWINTSDYSIRSTLIRAEVDLSTTLVKIYDDDELIAESRAAIGTDATPTPLGTFYVAAKRRNSPAESYLGAWALVLSSFSETLETFSGGLPVIAIHGSNNPERELGRAMSNGCVRVPNEVIEFLAKHVPPGAPVIISA